MWPDRQPGQLSMPCYGRLTVAVPLLITRMDCKRSQYCSRRSTASVGHILRVAFAPCTAGRDAAVANTMASSCRRRDMRGVRERRRCGDKVQQRGLRIPKSCSLGRQGATGSAVPQSTAVVAADNCWVGRLLPTGMASKAPRCTVWLKFRSDAIVCRGSKGPATAPTELR